MMLKADDVQVKPNPLHRGPLANASARPKVADSLHRSGRTMAPLACEGAGHVEMLLEVA